MNENLENSYNEENSEVDQIAKIVVIGVGGGGNNTINSMVKDGIKGVSFVAANTDEQVLNKSLAHHILPLGKDNAKGLGAGANPTIGKKAAIDSEKEIKDMLKGADMVIVSAGMGGGTGTGAAPIIAKLSKELGALTVGVVTTPFDFEGNRRFENAKLGLEGMQKNTDSLIVVSNNKLLNQFGGIALKDSFIYADKIMQQTVRTITDLIAVPALINLDFADVSSVMKNKGAALIGIGRSSGQQDKAIKAAIHAISSPILEASIKGATDAIINISGGDITLEDANKAVDTIKKAAGADINIIFGVSINEKLGEDIYVSVIATGLDSSKNIEDEKKIKEDISRTISTIEIDFESEDSRKELIKDPLPDNDKITLTNDDYDTNSILFDDEDDDDLPEFLKN